MKKKVDELQEQLACKSQLLLRVQQGNDHTRGKRKRSASTGEYSTRHQHRLKKARRSACAASLKWLEQKGATALSIVVLNSKGVSETITLSEHLGDQSETESVNEEFSDRITMTLYIKDHYSISGQAYHEMASTFKGYKMYLRR